MHQPDCGPSNLIKIDKDRLLSDFLSLYETANDEHYLAGRKGGKTVPTIVGAGTSATADIPLTAELLERLFQRLSDPPSERSYKRLINMLQETFSEGFGNDPSLYSSIVKERFRDLLATAGIPRSAMRPFPNLANLLLVHCIHSGVLGPIVSLNVDPLLQTAASFLEDGGPKLRYVQNISEFSDIVRDFESHLIIQPHGTIEEPLSLRFVDEELIATDSVLTSGVSDQLEMAPGVLCVGFSWENGVIEAVIRSTLIKRKANGHKYVILATFYGEAPDEELNVLRRIAKDYPTCARIEYAENVSSDEFLEDLSVRVYEKTCECRDRGVSTYYARDPSRILAVNRLVSWLFESEKHQLSDKARWTYHSSLKHLMSIECVIYFVAASDPSSLSDLVNLVSKRPYLHELGYSDPTEHAEVIKEVIKSLVANKIIVRHEDSRWVRKEPRSLEELDGTLYVINPDLTMERFCELVLGLLTHSCNVYDKDLLLERAEMLGKIFRSLEVSKKDRPQDTMRAIALTTCFEKASVLPSAQAHDELLDRLKLDFKNAAQSGRNVTCYVYTETGDHLFNSDFYNLKGKVDFSDPSDLKRYMLEWLHPLLSPTNRCARIKLLLSITDPRWRVGGSERTARAAFIHKALTVLSKLPNVTIGYLPWNHHDDHMWLLKYGGDNVKESEGALFPRRHQESNQCLIHIDSASDVTRMINIFESQAKQFGMKLDEVNLEPWHVVAVTLVDGRTLDANGRVTGSSQLYVGVRRSETHRQHKRVASVPTKKVPRALFWDVVGEGPLPLGDGSTFAREFVNSREHRGRDPLIYVVDDLLAGKLGAASLIEKRDISYRAKAVVLKSGPSPLISDDDQDEFIHMVNALVIVDEGYDALLTATESYSPVASVSVEEFIKAVRDRTAVIEDGERGYPYVCEGLCVCTSDLLLKAMDPTSAEEALACGSEGPLLQAPEIISRPVAS